MGSIGCPETSVRNYRSLLRDSPEECSSLLLNIVYSTGPYLILEIKVYNYFFFWRKLRSLNSVIKSVKICRLYALSRTCGALLNYKNS